MKTKILLTVLVLSILGACNKDKYNTRPKLTFKNINTSALRQGDVVTFTMEITDAEGDIQDSIWIEKITRNCALSTFKDAKRMPQFTGTKNLKADIEVSYAYNNQSLGYPLIQGPQCAGRNDSTRFRFWVKDNGGNISDTVESTEFVILR